MNILIVDDDKIDRMRVKRSVSQFIGDISIKEVSSGEDCLNSLLSESFDVVLLDYNLPGATGIEVLDRMKQGSIGETAVIILSGNTNEDLAVTCLEHGAQDFIRKQDLDSKHLYRAIIHAKLRHKNEMELENSRLTLKDLAEHDQLTGLLNRYAFEHRVTEAMAFWRRSSAHVSLMLMDLDDFKWINDTFGHTVGDAVLVEVADRIGTVCRDDDFICRLGGDEFAFAIMCREENYAYLIAQRIFDRLSAPFIVGGQKLTINCSVGIADFTHDSSDINDVLKRADLAMYQAKAEGRNRFHYFNEGLQAVAIRRILVESELREAIQKKSFIPYYQPKIDAKTGLLYGAEALVRWGHPTQGMVGPAYFLDIAEQTGLIIDIDRIVIQKACAQHAQWLADHTFDYPIKMAMNISVRHFKDDSFLPMLTELLEKYEIQPSSIELEIVESELVQDTDTAIAVLDELAKMGIDVAIDDFGTGYSSLSYLKQFNVQVLKIDRSFLFDIPESEISSRLFKGMLNLSQSLELPNVVEGVETQAHVEKCLEYNAEILQGYYFAKPLTAQEFANYIPTKFNKGDT
ncbi:EAL domain-containing protein [Reinekea marina]|uniref:EAL domain-containing protein n=1 Tax=Reinekea marina TaxID=1310421 RepID=A0ABV7WQU6_9GAMM|nr:GGDEF domain-containing response regulator [Reinekea marina]MDN3650407.1 EAL domain-containing protein [Reinekea marina]